MGVSETHVTLHKGLQNEEYTMVLNRLKALKNTRLLQYAFLV